MPETATLTATAPSVGGDSAPVSAPSIADSPAAVEEQPIGTPGTGETAEPEAAPSGETGTQEATTESTEESSEDGRLLPKAIRALKDTDPAAYKTEKARFFEHKEYKTAFPTVAEARKAKQALEIAGGEAGLAQMQTDITDFKEVASQFINGDPRFVDDLIAEDPVAFGTHVPHMLDKYAQTDRDGYNRVIAQQFSREFGAVKFRPVLESLAQAVNSGNKEQALEILNNIAGWHDKVEQVAKQEEDPRYKKLQEELRKERTAKSESERETFHREYRTEATDAIGNAALNAVKSYTKGQNLDEKSLQLLAENAIRIANSALEKNDDYKRKRDMLFSRRDKTASVRFAVAAFNEALAESVKAVARAFGRTGTAPKPKESATNGNRTPAKAPADGFVKVTTRPNGNEIDRRPGKTTASMIINEQRAILKDGRKVTWAA